MKKIYVTPETELSLLSAEDLLMASLDVSDEYGVGNDQGGMDWNNPN